MPAADDECEDESNQVEVKEIEHVADQCGGEDLVLVRGQRHLSLQVLKHCYSSPSSSQAVVEPGVIGWSGTTIMPSGVRLAGRLLTCTEGSAGCRRSSSSSTVRRWHRAYRAQLPRSRRLGLRGLTSHWPVAFASFFWPAPPAWRRSWWMAQELIHPTIEAIIVGRCLTGVLAGSKRGQQLLHKFHPLVLARRSARQQVIDRGHRAQQLGDGRLGDRPAEQVALRVRASRPRQGGELLARLHALGRRCHAELATERGHRAHDGAAV